jgi:hypothetical protein
MAGHARVLVVIFFNPSSSASFTDWAFSSATGWAMCLNGHDSENWPSSAKLVQLPLFPIQNRKYAMPLLRKNVLISIDG